MFLRERFEIRLNAHEAVFPQGPHFRSCTHSEKSLSFLVTVASMQRMCFTTDEVPGCGVFYCLKTGK